MLRSIAFIMVNLFFLVQNAAPPARLRTIKESEARRPSTTESGRRRRGTKSINQIRRTSTKKFQKKRSQTPEPNGLTRRSTAPGGQLQQVELS